jgi:hypothetical protein
LGVDAEERVSEARVSVGMDEMERRLQSASLFREVSRGSWFLREKRFTAEPQRSLRGAKEEEGVIFGVSEGVR